MSRGEQIGGRLTLSQYKRLILLGKLSLPLEEARRIVGPDCAYHLYFRHAGDELDAEQGADREIARPHRRARRRHK